jgi:hypothetical protein
MTPAVFEHVHCGMLPEEHRLDGHVSVENLQCDMKTEESET